jgi:hypothetical protein
LIDDEDYDYLNQFKWFAMKCRNTSYVYKSNKEGKFISMHRTIMNFPDKKQVDHLDHNGLNNQKENLRIVTNRVNGLNRVKNKNKFGFPGVRECGNRFASQMYLNGKHTTLGIYDTPLEAHNRYMDEFNKIQ